MKAEWCVYNKPLSKDLCEAIITQALRVHPEPALVGLDARVDEDYRSCTCRWLYEDMVDPDDGGLTWKDLFGHLKQCLDVANVNLFGVDCWQIRSILFATYQPAAEKPIRAAPRTRIRTWRTAGGERRSGYEVSWRDLRGRKHSKLFSGKGAKAQAAKKSAEVDVPRQDDHFEMHKDTFWFQPQMASHRKLSVTVQLSDPAEYEGADFEFHKDINPPGKELLRPQGTILIFPSPFYHRVTPIIQGTRHALVAFYEGPKWR